MDLRESLWNFIKEYYIDSIVYKEGYNIVNTLTWAAILIVAVAVLYRYLERRLSIDQKFVYSTLGYVLFGSAVRVVEDGGFLQPPVSYIFMTPFIYLLVFALTFPTLLITLKVYGERYYRVYSAFGLLLGIAALALLFSHLKVENWWVMPAGIVLAFAAVAAYRFLAPEVCRNGISYLAFFSHMLDGFETYFGIQYLGYWELHVLPRFLIEKFGAVSLPIAKFVVFLPLLYLIDSSDEKESLKNFVKFVLVVLGLAPGLRDGIRMTFGV